MRAVFYEFEITNPIEGHPDRITFLADTEDIARRQAASLGWPIGDLLSVSEEEGLPICANGHRCGVDRDGCYECDVEALDTWGGPEDPPAPMAW